MLRIKITSRGYKQMQKSLDNIVIKSKLDMVKLGAATVDTMKNHIESSIKREGSTAKLAGSIRSYVFNLGKQIVVGIGKVAELPIYWAAQNFGSSHLVGKRVPGYFGGGNRPISGGSGQRFTYKKKSFLMTVGKPIPAKNFVERTWTSMKAIIPTLFRRM